MIPSTIIFISVACGAGTSAPPYPQAAFRRYRTPPIARPDTTTPIISPICCFLGVAPSRYPVFRSCDVSPAIAATIQITDPIAIAAVIPSIPVLPLASYDCPASLLPVPEVTTERIYFCRSRASFSVMRDPYSFASFVFTVTPAAFWV